MIEIILDFLAHIGYTVWAAFWWMLTNPLALVLWGLAAFLIICLMAEAGRKPMPPQPEEDEKP